MATPPELTVHVHQAAACDLAACTYRKRRCVPPSMTRLREGPSEVTPGRSGRVERRTAGITGRRSFVSIHTRPTVPREPSPEVYRGAREARQILFRCARNSMGKGLKSEQDETLSRAALELQTTLIKDERKQQNSQKQVSATPQGIISRTHREKLQTQLSSNEMPTTENIAR